MKVAHISDIHLDKYHKPLNYLRTLQLLEYVRENKFDHVIISGDLTENAEASSMELTRDLLKKFGLLSHDKLTVTIGNHDIYGGVHYAEDIINFPAKCKKTNFEEKVKMFAGYFRETFSQKVIPGNNIFPAVKIFDEFVLININSIAKYSMLKNPFASRGEIAKEQMTLLGNYFKTNEHTGKQRIAVTHHHFCRDIIEESDISTVWQAVERRTMKLKGKKSLIKSFKKLGISTVLHGHLHESTTYTRRQLKFINAGGSILGTYKDKLKLMELTVNKDGISNDLIQIPYYETKIKNTFSFFTPQKRIVPPREEICLN